MIANGYKVSFGGDGNILKLIVAMICDSENILKSTELDVLIG